MAHQRNDEDDGPYGKRQIEDFRVGDSADHGEEQKTQEECSNRAARHLSYSPEKAYVESDEHDYAYNSIGVKLLQELVVRMTRFKLIGTVGRNHLPDRMKAVADPGMLHGFVQDHGPDAEAACEALSLVAGVGINVIVSCQQIPEDENDDQRCERNQYLGAAPYGPVLR